MIRSVALVLGGLCSCVVALELLFRVLPVSTATLTGYHVDPDLLTYPPRHEFRVATGWDLRNAQVVRANAQGFAARRDFQTDPAAIALIGDSYVEASMLPEADRPGVQLESALASKRPVYAMGGPGSSLLDYAQRVRWAAQNHGVRDFVLLLERFDARQALCGSGNVHSRCLAPQTLEPRVERQPEPSTLKRLLRHSAFAQYMVSQVGFTPGALVGAMFSRQTPEHAAEPASKPKPAAPTESQRLAADRMVNAVVDEFYAVAGPHLAGRIVFLVDGQRDRVAQEDARSTLGAYERVRLIAALQRRGAGVVDLEPVYLEHGATSDFSLNVGPYDGHLNALGVKLVMAEAARHLALQPGVSR